MILKVASKLPTNLFGAPGTDRLLAQGDIRIGSSRLAAKVLVFDRPEGLREFWREGLGKSELGKDCRGVVNSLITEVNRCENGRWVNFFEADARYFCLIGLCASHLSMEIICHESVHAAFSYLKRVKRCPWDEQSKHFHEEALAYPTGAMARELNKFLFRHNLYEIGEKFL